MATHVVLGRWPDARQHLLQQLPELRRLGSQRWVGETLEFGGLTLEGLGRQEPALRMLRTADAVRAQTGEQPGGGIKPYADLLRAAAGRLRDLPGPIDLPDPDDLDAVLAEAMAALGGAG